MDKLSSFPEHSLVEIEEGQRLRGWIANAYAQIEFLLGDLILRSRKFSEYSEETRIFTHSAIKRAERIRRMLAKEGPLRLFADEMESIITQFEKSHETRNLLAHGFCEYLYTPSGDTALQFQKWHRQDDRDDARLVRSYRIAELRAEMESFVVLSNDAMLLFQRLHRHFGWAARPDR